MKARVMLRYGRAIAQDAAHTTICLVEVACLWWRNERPSRPPR
jgi:hypothetical protein